MNWTDLLAQAKNNPEIRALISRMAGKAEPVLDKAGVQAATEGVEQGMKNVRAENLSKALPPAPLKSAGESAEVFNNSQNFDLVGSPRTEQNFRLVGEPHGTNYPSAAVKEPNLPIQRGSTALEANEAPVMEAAFRDVSEAAAPAVEQKMLSAADEGVETVSKGISKKAKLGLGAGLGGAALLSLQGDSSNNLEAPERKEAAAEVVQEKPKAVAPSKEKTDSNDEEETDESDVTPSQKTQAEAKQPAGESDAPQKQEPTPSYLNFEGRGSGDNELNKLLDAQREEVRNQKILESIAMIGGGLAGVKPDRQIYKDAIAASGLPIEQYKIKQANEPNDPNSGLSQGLRDYMKKLGVNVSENATAAQIQSVLPMVYKDIEAKQAQEAKSADLKNRLEVAQKMKEAQLEQSKVLNTQRKQDKQEATTQKRDDAQQKEDTNRLDKLNKSITAEVASSRSAFGQAARNHQSIENAQALLNGEVDPNQLDNRQVYELAKVLDRVLSQTGTTISGTEHLTPDTARGRLAKLTEFITNKRQSAGAGSFIHTFQDTLNREQDLAIHQMTKTQKAILGSTRDLQKRQPQAYRDILTQHGLPLDIFEQAVPVIPRGNALTSTDPRDQAAIKKIVENNPGISIQDAAKALNDFKKSRPQ